MILLNSEFLLDLTIKAMLLSPDSHSDARQCPQAYFCVVGVRAYLLFVALLLHLTLVRVPL